MTGRKKISRIALLMVISCLLLMAFVFRWLQSEYNGEKMTLQKDLFGEFASARSRVTDSLIAKHLISPILNDTVGLRIQTTDDYTFSDEHGKKMITYNRPDMLPPGCDSGTSFHPPDQRNLKVRIESDSVDILYKGVKMFISQVNGPHGEEEFFERFIEAGDTSMLKNFFSENLNKSHLNVKPVWVSNYEYKGIPPPRFYYESHFFDHPYGVRIENYNPYLYRRILPQSGFGLLLIILTTTAFIFSFRSLRSQLRLAVIKDDLISNISHELKTPVATVKVAIEAMQQMDPVEKKDKIKDYLHMASQEVNRLDLLVNKVMNSILLDNGRQVFQIESINLKALVEEIITAMQMQAQQRNATLQFHSDLQSAFIDGDEIHLRGVIYNLIENALKYGNENPAISLRITETDNKIILQCTDNGPGIPEEYISKVFDKFFRVPMEDTHSVKGYGLGLYYVKQVMEQLGGSAEVSNNAVAGCTFILKFPRTKA